MLGSFAERFQLSTEQAMRLGCAFGGGIAGMAHTCGAVSGAVMVLGLAHGASAEKDKGKKQTYGATRELWKAFEGRHGSTVCRDLLGVDIATRDGLEVAIRTGLFKTRCPAFVRDAAEITAGLV